MGRKNRNGRARHAMELHSDIIYALPEVTGLCPAPPVNTAPLFGAACMFYYVVITTVLTATSLAGINITV